MAKPTDDLVPTRENVAHQLPVGVTVLLLVGRPEGGSTVENAQHDAISAAVNARVTRSKLRNLPMWRIVHGHIAHPLEAPK